jgi:putative ABC transport system permease protein
VWRFVVSQFRHRRSRPLAVGVGVLVASVSFVLLASAAKTNELRVHGSLKSNYRAAYDVLVRPRGSKTALERSRGLVRANYLSGIFGGITSKQYATIEHIPGVEVAAPIANVGYVLPTAHFPVLINKLLDRQAFQLYRLRFTYTTNSGSRYPASSEYVYYETRDPFAPAPDRFSFGGELVNGKIEPVCDGFVTPTAQGPFDQRQQENLTCFSARSPSHDLSGGGLPASLDGIGTFYGVSFPIFVAAIDPRQEAKLVKLDQTIVAGRYLRESDGTTTHGALRYVPVIASNESFLGEQLQVSVERLRIPAGTDVPRALESGVCLSNSGPPCTSRIAAPKGATYKTAYGLLTQLPGKTIATLKYSFAPLYRDLLSGTLSGGRGRIEVPAYWTTSPVHYRTLAPDHVAPLPTHNPISVWQSQLVQINFSGYIPAPPDNQDTQLRRLHERQGSNQFAGGTLATPLLKVVGSFDPRKLPGFSPLSKVPLETFYPPVLQPANSASKRALRGKPLLPTQNVGGYIEQPPLLLTTLSGLKALTNSASFSGANSKAPISAIQVRVKDVTGPDPLSEARIQTVAQEIHDETGLDVDITAGSSPHPILVSLPRGRYGQPPLLVSEGWSKKGVTLSFLRALDRKDSALFALILLVGAIFIANGALAATRARRGEIGTLLTLGWSPAAIFRSILAELALVGVLAGTLGAAVAATLAASFGLRVSLPQTLLVVPVAIGLTLVAGIIPAWTAARGLPLDAIRPPVVTRKRSSRVTSLHQLALLNLTRLPVRTLIGSAGLFLGVAALTILISIERAFQGTLVGTLLGNAISLQVRGADFAAVAIVIALAALSAADVLYLNLRERTAEFATLYTLGWTRRHLALVGIYEGIALGTLGSLTGAIAGTAIATGLLGVSVWPVAISATAALAGGIAAAAAASLIPVLSMARTNPVPVLAAE